MKKNKLIPFKFLPASWGLEGSAYAEAEAYYNFDGEDLERRLIQIKFNTAFERKVEQLKLDLKYDYIAPYDFDVEMAKLKTGSIDPKTQLDIDLKYNKINEYDYDCKLVELQYPDKDSLEHQVGLLTADHKHHKITTNEFEKTLANSKNEPWVGVVNNGFNSEEGVNGLYFELDWNQQWVDHLRTKGYHGVTEEQIVEQWFSDVCRAQADENPPEPDEPLPFNSSRLRNSYRT